MKKYKGLFVPPVVVDIEDIRVAYCNGSLECVEGNHCFSCMYAPDNIDKFKEWYEKKKGK